jgi:signal transduction histidine kinase
MIVHERDRPVGPRRWTWGPMDSRRSHPCESIRVITNRVMLHNLRKLTPLRARLLRDERSAHRTRKGRLRSPRTMVGKCAWLSAQTRRSTRPPITLGILIGGLCVVVETLLAYLVEHFTHARMLGSIYLLGVIVVSLVWGLALGMASALASSLAFLGYYYLVPGRAPGLGYGTEWAAFLIFLVVAMLVSMVAARARSQAVRADERRREADVAAELARLLLGSDDLNSAMRAASHRLAQAMDVPYLAIEFGKVPAGDGRLSLPLREGATVLGTLVVPADLPAPMLRRMESRVVPSLVALLRAARDRAVTRSALNASRDELSRIAERQAALRRVATLVARAVSAGELFNAVACEMGRILGSEEAAINRFEADGGTTPVGWWSSRDSAMPPASAWSSHVPSVSELVFRTGQPARMTDHAATPGEIAAWARMWGIASSVGVPIVVGEGLWGVMITYWRASAPPPGVEERMLEFTELVATAVANAHAREELAASRARVVAASDETRRHIERDLHDGAQQRLVSLGLELRAVEADVPPKMQEVRGRLSHTVETVVDIVEELRELSRGLHPAALAGGGLGPALKSLARRSSAPLELSIRLDRRLPERVEVAVYYVVCEALTNIAKHANASVAHVDLTAEHSVIRLAVRDDGIGGADPACGSGLIGLRDRVEAIGGIMEVVSPRGCGTSLLVEVPVNDG